MAIKLITKGIPPQEKIHKTGCLNCLSTYEYTIKDLKHEQREGSYFMCTVCNHTVWHRFL